MAKRFYITTPIYYVNDRPHIGHAYTTIAADVLARYYRQREYDVFFLTGTDEHGDKVAESAEKAGQSVQAFVDHNAGEFSKAFANLEISHDIFMRTTLKEHAAAVKIFMEKLHAHGALYQGTYEGLYCRGCEDFYTEKDLIDGLCPIHKQKPEVVKEKNWFFKLTQYLPEVQRLIQDNVLVVEPASRRSEVLGLLKQDLKDFSVTRERVRWGIDFPIYPTQKIYVWVEALQNYISAIGYGQDQNQFMKWWPADVHLMAKDIVKFHAIYWPAMLLAAGEKLPKKIFAHGFFSLNGQKMSKSLGNVIDPNDVVREFGPDATRYLLLSQFPFGQDGDIKQELFKEKYNADLANNLGNLVSRVLNMIEQYCGGRIPRDVESPIFLDEVEAHIERLAFDVALKKMWAAIDDANHMIDDQKPWVLVKDPAQREALELLLSQLARFLLDLVKVLEPFMPNTAAQIVGAFSAEKITKGTPLFMRK
ncbi:MAG: class I tRNA ligase family protein [Patescibacteria group bacterium]